MRRLETNLDDVEAIPNKGIIHLDLREDTEGDGGDDPQRTSIRGQRHPVVDRPDDVITTVREKSFDVTTEDADTLTIARGYVHYHGRFDAYVEESDAKITGGTENAPQWVSVRVALVPETTTGDIVVTDTRPVSDNSYFYKPLYTYYLDDSVAVFDHDWRHDIDLGSPIA